MTEQSLQSKWTKFHRRAALFNHIPFIDFVLASGSMAMGTAREDSDFDVIIGVKEGRIFTARFIAVLLFGLLGWRVRNGDKHGTRQVKDKICLNHFVTPESYRLSPPHNEYWKKLYESLKPLIGDKEKINKFFAANDWIDAQKIKDKHSHILKNVRMFSWTRTILDSILRGKFGDLIERVLRNIQVRRIEKSIMQVPSYKPRIIYSDQEMEFHPNTQRIDKFCGERELTKVYN